MSNSTIADRIPLTGADCMLRAFDWEVQRYHSSSHVSQLVLRLAPGLDVHRLREVIAQTAVDTPILRAAIRRRWKVGRPVYDMRGLRPEPPLRVHAGGAESAWDACPPAVFTAALNEKFHGTRGELLRFDLIRYDDGACDLAMSWLHMLLDGTGSELFVRALADVAAGSRELVGLDVGSDSDDADLSFRARGDRARQWQAFQRGLADHLPGSPGGPLRRVRQDLHYRVTTLSVEDTARIAAIAVQKAGFLTPVMYYMAAAVRAHHRMMVQRGAVPASYVIPLPVNTRRRGEEGAIFRTHVSMLWFQVLPRQVEDFDELLAELKRQRLEMIRGGLVESGACAIEFARYLPAGVFGRMVRRTFAGELCSFFFAFTGSFLGDAEEFLGVPIRNGFHVPAVPPSPGSCAAMSVFKGRLNLTHVYQKGAVSELEAESFAAAMREELG